MITSLLSGIQEVVTKMRNASIQSWMRRQILKNTKAVKDLNNLKINSKQKTFSLELDLVGETEPLAVSGRYELTKNGGKTFFAPANDLQTSKEWLTILASEFLKGRSFEIPGFVSSFL
jgi:hypothetical protein